MLAQEGHGRQARVPGGHDGGHSGVELSGESNGREEHKRVSEAPSLPPSLAGRDASPDPAQTPCNTISPVCHTKTTDLGGRSGPEPRESSCLPDTYSPALEPEAALRQVLTDEVHACKRDTRMQHHNTHECGTKLTHRLRLSPSTHSSEWPSTTSTQSK